ncbi:hypothetical protein QJS10_CPB14g00211 [Acorus calamus]|uniref:Wall-associated receptor kinase galacturonan-binding domain-containing protein n=1 Tax=Acorus calamus TaxID=4465 RepID=A0AAV9DAV6_ACOCL|nr:hypothetical protein QJS10_CPB14g00211 [Acorus calamus]
MGYRNLEQSCPLSSCGDLHNISDPFRLKDDPVGCGDPDFELSCVANQTILLIQNMPFYVKEINYTSRHLRIVDVGLANDKYPNLSSLAGVQRLLANGFYYMWSEICYVDDLLSDCYFQCSKNATRDYFVSMFRENQDSIDENLNTDGLQSSREEALKCSKQDPRKEISPQNIR